MVSMSSVDLDKFESRGNVTEAHEVVGVWEFWIQGLDQKLMIKVLRYNRDDVPYMGVANLEIKNSKQADFYISLQLFATIQDAIDDSLRGFLIWYDPDDEGLQVQPHVPW